MSADAAPPVSSDNPLLEWCNVRTIRHLVGRVERAAHLSAGAIDFMWTLAFTSAWLRQLPARS